MKIRNPAVRSNVFELVRTIEMDIDLGPELVFPLRIELLRDTEIRTQFRAWVYEMEHFSLRPSFPVRKNGKRQNYMSMELLWLERGSQLTGDYRAFKARGVKDAMNIVLTDFKARLKHWTGVKAA